MIVITNEEKALKIASKYRHTVAFSLAKGAKGIKDESGKIVLNYTALGFLPTEDEINAVKAGDISLKKLIKQATKAIKKPTMDNASVSLSVAQLITMITSNRKAPVIMVLIPDETDEARNKILIKYVLAVLKIFGLTPAKNKALKKAKLFKGKRRKVVTKVIKFNNSADGQRMSKKGADLKKMLLTFYELELRQSSMSQLKVATLDGDETRLAVKNLLRTFTATNLQDIAKKKTCKELAHKDKVATKAYKELRDILKTMDIKLPKAEYGQKKKGKKAVGAKMDTKKFIKFFAKKKRRTLLILIYGHILARILELDTKEYNSHMKSVVANFDPEFAKAFIEAVKAYGAKGE